MQNSARAISQVLSSSLSSFETPQAPPPQPPSLSLSKGGKRRGGTKLGSKRDRKRKPPNSCPAQAQAEVEVSGPSEAPSAQAPALVTSDKEATRAVVIEVEATDKQEKKGKEEEVPSLTGKREASEVAVGQECSHCHKDGELHVCSGCQKVYHERCGTMSRATSGTWRCLPCQYCGRTIVGTRNSRRTPRRVPSPRRLGPNFSSSSSRSFRPHCPPYLTKFDSPENVKNGKIQYPLDDRLLREMPDLHEITILPVLPDCEKHRSLRAIPTP
jgi:hypothetical protein